MNISWRIRIYYCCWCLVRRRTPTVCRDELGLDVAHIIELRVTHLVHVSTVSDLSVTSVANVKLPGRNAE